MSDERFESDFPEEATQAGNATPIVPGTPPDGYSATPTRRRTGSYPPISETTRRTPTGEYPGYDLPRDVSRPALPRQARQSRPLPPPPPEPPPGTLITEPRPGRKPPRSKRESGLYLPWWSLVIMVVFVGGAAIGAWAVLDSLGGNRLPGGETPIVIVVTSTIPAGPPPTHTPIPLPPTQPPPAILPTVAPTSTLPPGDFRIGATVEVIGVGQAGLNIRSGPGVDSTIRYQAPEKTRFTIKSGPQTASGDEWWELQEVNDPNKSGWASRRFLQAVTSP